MQLCDVLDYLQRQTPPVVFRDLKPSNVILSPEGRLVLVDFGIARYFKEGQINDTTDFGSPGYASPEQYEGSGQTDGRSDIYSLGVILHEMLSGKRPARGGTRGSQIETLRQINPALSPALSGLVAVATRPEPMYRFQTAHAFYLALERTRIHRGAPDISPARGFSRRWHAWVASNSAFACKSYKPYANATSKHSRRSSKPAAFSTSLVPRANTLSSSPEKSQGPGTGGVSDAASVVGGQFAAACRLASRASLKSCKCCRQARER